MRRKIFLIVEFRFRQRKTAKQRAVELMRKGDHSEARKYLKRCVDITHEMALRLIQCCRKINVDCVVAVRNQ